MPRTTRTVTFSLPPELADRMDEMTERLGQSRSSLIREATVRYLEDCEWQELLQYGERTARNQGIGVEDVSPLVEEYRAEVGPGSDGFVLRPRRIDESRLGTLRDKIPTGHPPFEIRDFRAEGYDPALRD